MSKAQLIMTAHALLSYEPKWLILVILITNIIFHLYNTEKNMVDEVTVLPFIG